MRLQPHSYERLVDVYLSPILTNSSVNGRSWKATTGDAIVQDFQSFKTGLTALLNAESCAKKAAITDNFYT